MRRAVTLLLVFAFAAASHAAQPPNAKRCFWWTEYNREVKGAEGLLTINVCFGDATGVDVAKVILSAELAIFVEAQKALAGGDLQKDVMCTAWDSTGELERQIVPRDETPYYSAKLKKITTWKEALKK
jgi:hypothetical protein